MKRLLTVALLAVACVSGHAPEPLPPPEIEYPDIFVNWRDESRVETWSDTLVLTAEFLKKENCRRAFMDATGLDPMMMPTLGYVSIVFPDPWPHPQGTLGVCMCLPKRLSVNGEKVYSLGSLMGAALLVHESAHLALCKEKIAGRISDHRNERIAREVEDACVWRGTKSLLSHYDY